MRLYSHRPFSFSVLLLGDFCQLPPNVPPSLADVLVLYSSSRGAWSNGADAGSKTSLAAATLFMQFTRLLLTEQMRAADDPEHVALVKAFELTNKEPPLTAARLAGLQRLSPALLDSDPAFRDAKIAVQSNEERRLFNRLKTLEFGRVHREPVFRWAMSMLVAEGSDGKAKSDAWLSVGCTELEFLFVRGMPLVIKCKGKMGDVSWEIPLLWIVD